MYLYNLVYASVKRSKHNSSLNWSLFEQLIAMLYKCNPFIALYKTAYEHLQDSNSLPKIWIILNSQICLFWKRGNNHCHHYLPIANEIIIIILNKYNRASFWDIIFAYQCPENNAPIFQNISSNIAAYMLIYYVSFFLYRNLR